MPKTESLLAIDIGNTQTVLGILRGEHVVTFRRLSSGIERTGDELVQHYVGQIALLASLLDTKKQEATFPAFDICTCFCLGEMDIFFGHF